MPQSGSPTWERTSPVDEMREHDGRIEVRLGEQWKGMGITATEPPPCAAAIEPLAGEV